MTLDESTGDFGLFVTAARYLMRGTGVGALGTLEPVTASPYVSMITVSTAIDGTPIFLISKLAWHTRFLEADPRASILFSAKPGPGDPLALGRVSVMGKAAPTDAPIDRDRFLARHPEAAGYASFADFSFWRLQVEKAHYIGGFGRIGTISGGKLILSGNGFGGWNEEINRVLIELNDRFAGELARLAAQAGESAGEWRLAACDPEGAEIVSGSRALRIVFAEPLNGVHQVAEVLERRTASAVIA